MIHEDNAAGRLWVLFNAVRNTVEYDNPKSAWASALKLKTSWSEIDYHTAMIGAYGVLLEVHDELQSLNGRFDIERYFSYFNQWGRAFGLSSAGSLNAEKFVSQAAMDVLATLADILHGLGVRSGVSSAAKEAADTLLAEVTELINEVLLLEEMDADFRIFLLGHLSAIEGALRRFHLRGYREVDAVIGKLLGDAVRSPNRWAGFVEHPIWKPFRSVLRALNLLSSGSQDATELAENARKLFELGS